MRVNFHCNQACHVCFVSTHLPPLPEEVVREAIVRAGRTGGVVALSGGEATLNPALGEHVRLARASGACRVELQANAVKFSDPEYAREIIECGVDTCFVSLHGATGGVSDRVTGAPGTFARTLLGVDRLHALGVELRLNIVHCELNRHEIELVVDLIAGRWPRAQLVISVVAPSTDLVPSERWLIPRWGVRRRYVELYGTSELHPLAPAPDEPAHDGAAPAFRNSDPS